MLTHGMVRGSIGEAATATPCGACRQVIVEFNPAMMVLSISHASGEIVGAWRASSLLPHHFGPAHLQGSAAS